LAGATNSPGPAAAPEQLAGVRIPTLTLLAGESRMHDAGKAADMARRVPADSTVIVHPDASHAINGEYPDRIADDIATFLTNRP
jgi:pimeloyl-ACP methyl ester carboxylesterase